MNELVPRGYFSPEKAIEYFGRRLKFAGRDTTKLSEIGREALKRELEKTEKASSKQEIQQLLRHLLFEEILSAKHFIGGKLLSLESSIWGRGEAERIFASGWATICGGHEYFPAEVRGRVLIKQSSIDALFDGDSDEVETGTHVEPNLPDEPAEAVPPPTPLEMKPPKVELPEFLDEHAIAEVVPCVTPPEPEQPAPASSADAPEEMQPESHILTDHEREKGGKRSKINEALQQALNRIAADLSEQGKRITRGFLRDWVTEKTPQNEFGESEPYSFDPLISNCDDLYIDGSKLVWKDRESREHDNNLKNLDRYIERAQKSVARAQENVESSGSR